MVIASLNNISVKFSQTHVLNNICLEISSGDFIVICGANGAGKSTLLKILCGLAKPSSGNIAANIKGNEVAYVPQNAMPDKKCPITVKEAIMTGAVAKNGIFKKTKSCDIQGSEDLIKKFGLKSVENALCGNISGGQAQRMQIARAFLQQPKLLLLDEPFSSLDKTCKETLTKTLVDYNAKTNCAIVMATHIIHSLPHGQYKTIKLEHGNII
ncbi:MAG: ATP-binding cassette domain-containing protein [Elusimicrobia bacterium]|nr:ATP-binding cassette domain-containing protein [Elusimicrobiota bacterium]